MLLLICINNFLVGLLSLLFVASISVCCISTFLHPQSSAEPHLYILKKRSPRVTYIFINSPRSPPYNYPSLYSPSTLIRACTSVLILPSDREIAQEHDHSRRELITFHSPWSFLESRYLAFCNQLSLHHNFEKREAFFLLRSVCGFFVHGDTEILMCFSVGDCRDIIKTCYIRWGEKIISLPAYSSPLVVYPSANS